MPGFDGTGPRGLGPMTGDGRGFCVVRLPDGGDPTQVGIAGLSCNAASEPGFTSRAQLAFLKAQSRRVEMLLELIRDRIRTLERAGARTGGSIR